jgi:hypothetical protein
LRNGEIVTDNLFDKIHADPRWLPFLRKIGEGAGAAGEDRVQGDAAARKVTRNGL